jgi:hypothetical protein
MNHKGVEYTLMLSTTRDIRKWQFQIGNRTVKGKTEARLLILATRRVQFWIDRELREARKGSNPTPGILLTGVG